MSSSRRTRRRCQQQSFRRHQLRLESLEKRFALNAAPVLTPDGYHGMGVHNRLGIVVENSGAPVGQVGTPVSAIIGTTYPNNFSDFNSDRPGIAITDTNLLGGTLWVSYDNGETWSDVGLVDESNPLLATADSNTRLYFQPANEFHGTIEDVMTFKAWDTNFSYATAGQQLHGQSVGEQAGKIALSLDGSIMVVGAPESDINGESSGNVRVYRQDNNQWQQIGATLHGLPGDKFGHSVSISDDGNIIAVGAYLGDSASTDDNVGYVSVFEKNNETWVQRGEKIFGKVTGELSGFSTALSSSGDRVAVGSIFALDGNVESAGITRVYEWSASSWSQVGGDISQGYYGDQFGYSVDLSSDGMTVAVSAPLNPSYGGVVEVYKIVDTNWMPKASRYYTMRGGGNSNFFGHSVSLSSDGTKIAVGSPGYDHTGSDMGRAQVFEFMTHVNQYNSAHNYTYWGEIFSAIGQAGGDHFGSSVEISDDGTILVVGAPDNDFESVDAGVISIYQNTTDQNNSYEFVGSMDGHVVDEQFGTNVAISGNGTVVAGSSPNSDVSHEDAGVIRALRATSGFNSLSAAIDTISVYVQENPGTTLPTNAPPSLDISKNPVLQQQRFHVPPVGSVGALVSDFIDQSGPLSNYSDTDGNAPGLAIVGANIGNGKLWFTTNNGDSWADVGTVSTTSARVLFADSHTRLFYQSADIEDDANALNIQFKAWDRTGFSNGDSGADTTVSMAPDQITTYDVKESLLDITSMYSSSSGNVLVDSDYDDSSGLLAVASQNAFVLFDVTVMAEPVALGTYKLFDFPQPQNGYTQSPSNPITNLTLCGQDVLVVSCFDGATSGNRLVFDIRSPDSPRLVQNFNDAGDVLWHDTLNLGYSSNLFRDPTQMYYISYFHVNNGRIVEASVDITSTDGQRQLADVQWQYDDAGEWYAFSTNTGSMQYDERFERLSADGEFISEVAENSPLNVGMSFVPKSFSDEFWLTANQVVDIHTAVSNAGSSIEYHRQDFQGLRVNSFQNNDFLSARIKSTGESCIAVQSVNGLPWQGVLAVNNPWDDAHNFIDSSFQVEGTVADLELDASDRYLFVTDTSGLVYVLDTESIDRFSSRIETASIDLTQGTGASDPYQNVLPDVYVAPPATGSTASAVVSLEEALDVVPANMPVAVTAASENKAVIGDPVVLVGNDGRPTSLVLSGEVGVSGSAAIRVTLHTGGLDSDLNTPGDNQSAEYIFTFTQLRPYGQADSSLATDQTNALYVESEPVTVSGKTVDVEYFAFQPVSAAPSPDHNQLIVQREGTNYRLIADDAWRINGLFDSLRNESSTVLDLSAREVPSTLNIAAIAGAYKINGVSNPTIVVRRGQTYAFNLDTGIHPLWLQTTGNGYQEANSYSDGFTGNGQATGEHQWVVPEDAPDEIFYQCEFHPVMFGKIIVVD